METRDYALLTLGLAGLVLTCALAGWWWALAFIVGLIVGLVVAVCA